MSRWQLRVGPLVLGDLVRIEEYYKEVAPEQIPRWRREFKTITQAIKQNPFLSHEDRPNIRHRATSIFPYHIWFVLNEDSHTVTLVAVIHRRRDPAIAALRASCT